MPTREEELELLPEIWKTTIEVQQHFNDIAMKIRALFVTVVLALFAAEWFLFDKKSALFLTGGVSIPLTMVVPPIGIVATYLFYFADRYWYHQLLLGAVRHGLNLEKLHPDFPALRLTSEIGRASRVVPEGDLMKLAAYFFVSDPRYWDKKDGTLHSDARIELFYKPVVTIFTIMFLLAIAVGGLTFAPTSR
jgi:hypothetical protein